jgi:hypothetical protein
MCFLGVRIFLAGSANWVTELSKRNIDSSCMREMLSRAYVFESGMSAGTSRTMPIIVNSDCCYCYHNHRRRRRRRRRHKF